MSTFGSTVKVSYVRGRSELLGMTVGHAITKLKSRGAVETSAEPSSMLQEPHVSATDTQIDSSTAIGHVIDMNTLPGISAGRVKPKNDWALFTVREPLMNQASTRDDPDTMAETDLMRGIHVVEHPVFHDGTSDPVLLMGAAGGRRHGELSSLPAAILIDQSNEFVRAYPMQLADSTGMSNPTVHLKNEIISNEAYVMNSKSFEIALETNKVSLDNHLNAAALLRTTQVSADIKAPYLRGE